MQDFPFGSRFVSRERHVHPSDSVTLKMNSLAREKDEVPMLSNKNSWHCIIPRIMSQRDLIRRLLQVGRLHLANDYQ